MATLLMIDGTAIKNPSEMTVGIQDLDYEAGTGRNQAGEMFRDRVAVKRKLTCKWNVLNRDQLKDLLTAMTPVFFQVTYYDPLTDAQRTMTAYVGDRTAPIYCFDPSGKAIYRSLSANFIEK